LFDERVSADVTEVLVQRAFIEGRSTLSGPDLNRTHSRNLRKEDRRRGRGVRNHQQSQR
jgi:hypothetical protein